MKPLTDTHKQWIWFVLLWCGGLLSFALLAALVKWIIRVA